MQDGNAGSLILDNDKEDGLSQKEITESNLNYQSFKILEERRISQNEKENDGLNKTEDDDERHNDELINDDTQHFLKNKNPEANEPIFFSKFNDDSYENFKK